MSWFTQLSGDYTNWEAPGYALEQVGDRHIIGFNAVSSASSSSVIQASQISAVGYAVGVPTSNYITPQMQGDGVEIYGVIPRGGSRNVDNIDSVKGIGMVATTDSTHQSLKVPRQIFHIQCQVGARAEVEYDTASAPSIGNRVVMADTPGIVKQALAIASNGTFAAGVAKSNWIAIAIDSSAEYCIIEKVG